MKIARALPSTEPRTKRAAHARGRLWPMAALFIRGSVLGSASVAESASAFSGQPRTRERGPLRADAVGRSLSLRANIDETVLLVVITEQGENRNQCEEQWNHSGLPRGFARRGA